MLGLVGGHQLVHLLIEQLTVRSLVHIDKVDDDDTAQIAQTQLPGDFACSGQIDIESRLLLIVLRLGAIARIDVDDVHRLRVLDNQVSAPAQRHVLGEERLDLLRNVEIVEDGDVAPIKFYEFLALRFDLTDVVLNLMVHRFVVHDDLRKGASQRIPDNGVGPVHLAHQLGRSGILANILQGLLPFVQQGADILFDIAVLGLDSRRADDNAEILRQNGGCNALEPLLLLRRADLLRQEHLRRKRHQHHVASGQRNIGRQARSLGGNRLFGHLHHNGLPHLQVGADLARLFDRRLQLHRVQADSPLAGLVTRHQLLQRRELGAQVEIVDKGILLMADIDERGVQPRHDLAHLAQINIPYGESRLALLLVELDQHLVLAQGDRNLGRVYIDY